MVGNTARRIDLDRINMSLAVAMPRMTIAGLFVVALLFSSCSVSHHDISDTGTSLHWLSYRVRSDANAPLNHDGGWAAPENAAASLFYDQPFRLRIQTLAASSPPEGFVLSLQYRELGGDWLPAGYAEFPYPAFASPMVSIVSTQAYSPGDETDRLLGHADVAWDNGAGLSAVAVTPVWRTSHEALEWEWPMVVRRFSDGPGFADDNKVFEVRVVDGLGRPLAGQQPVRLEMSALPGHLGGTFVETPARLGPYQSERGHLYFFMEPSETDNRFMAVRSVDFGHSWQEIDGTHRPDMGDLEGVATAQRGSTIHIIHQVSEEVLYHRFDLDSGTANTASWQASDETIASPEEPPTQMADLVARSDGSLVTVYGGARHLYLQTRSPDGEWSQPLEIDSGLTPDLSGPALAVGPDDVVTVAYTGKDGSGFVRHLLADNSLSPRQLLSSNLGTLDSDNGAIAPMIVLPETGTTVLLYREQDGVLLERRFTRDGILSQPINVTTIPVVTNAVDSEQVGADLVLHNNTLHLLFIDASTRSIYHTQSREPGLWAPARVVADNVDAAWIRGSVHRDANGSLVYGFVFDAGSTGGSGFNRYLALPL